MGGRKALRRLAVCCAGAAILALSAVARAADVPTTAEPGRSSEELKQPSPSARSTTEPVIPLRPRSTPPADAQAITFTLREIRLTGATVLSEADLAGAWTKYFGQTIPISTLYEIVNAITARYADAGYVISFALLPEQDITNGSVAIVVVEGFVDDIVVNGFDASGGFLTPGAQIRAQSERIKASKPLRTAELERALLLLNDLPGVTARAVFAASKSTRNASTLTINIERKRLEVEIEANNRLPEAFGRWRAGGRFTFSGVLTGTDAVALTAYHGLEDEGFAFGAARVAQVLNAEGLSVALAASYSKDRAIKGLLESIDFEGEDRTVRFDLAYPLIRTRPRNLTIGASVVHDDTETEALGVPLTEDKVRYAEAWATLDFADRTGAINLIRVNLDQGFDVLDATDETSTLKSRATGSPVFTNVGLFASRLQPVFGSVSFFGEFVGQAALGDPLLAVSECSYGGQTIGRGYDAGALSGDHCVSGLAELRVYHEWNVFGVQLYGFADGAFVIQKGVLEPGEKRNEQASSAGGGVRLFVGADVSLGAEIAVPLRDKFVDDSDGDTRAFFSAAARF